MLSLCRKPLEGFRGTQPLCEVGLDCSEPTAKSGLTEEQARQRLQTFGENVPEKSRKTHWSKDLVSRFKNPLVLILLSAGLVSACTGEMAGSIIIFAVITISITMDFLQQFRSVRAVERLSASVLVTSTVIFNGEKKTIPSKEIVPGDLVLLGGRNPISCRMVCRVFSNTDFGHFCD